MEHVRSESASASGELQFAAGDHLSVWRGAYSHHGIATGEGTVVHYAGLAQGLTSGAAPIEEVSIAAFAQGRRVKVVRHPRRKYCAAVSVARARSRMRESYYSVVWNNCEHFVDWAIEGLHESPQVDRATGGFGLTAGAGSAAGSGALVATSGSVAGLSGPGVMSGLASIGPGGAVGGLATLAGAAGIGTTAVLCSTVLRDDERLEPEERTARQAGRWAAGGATAATAVGGVAAVAASGTTVGLSAAGISSGLAAIGYTATAGATGMIAGVGVVVAAPAVASVAAGLGVTWAVRRLKRRTSRQWLPA